MKMLRNATVFLLLCLAASVAAAQKEELSESYRGSQRNNVEYQKVAPIKVFDNL